jgi:hypothetical protein
MPTREVLLLAMTKMRSGICVAGLVPDPDPVTGLRWVRPVRDFDTVQPGDMSDTKGHLYQCGDVVELCLLKPRPDPPHVEDWLTDFVYHRPKLLRRLQGKKRAGFFSKYLDRAPKDVVTHCTRSLCLVKPMSVRARFSLDAYSHKYQVRMGFALAQDDRPGRPQSILWQTEPRGIPVTDLKWCALGKGWLGKDGGHLELTEDDIYERLEAEAIYLTVGLSRPWKNRCWPMVVGVHTVPDYESSVDLADEL